MECRRADAQTRWVSRMSEAGPHAPTVASCANMPRGARNLGALTKQTPPQTFRGGPADAACARYGGGIEELRLPAVLEGKVPYMEIPHSASISANVSGAMPPKVGWPTKNVRKGSYVAPAETQP